MGPFYCIHPKPDGSTVKVYRAIRGQAFQEVLSTTTAAALWSIRIDFQACINSKFRLDDILVIDSAAQSTWTYTNNNGNELTQMANSAQGSTISNNYDAWGRLTSKTMGSNSATYAYRYGGALYTEVHTRFDCFPLLSPLWIQAFAKEWAKILMLYVPM
ncbi:MAG: hypothetical protein HYV27_22645 [Candidatus Hydrogenedentes bacterium]|nr:hypothetical protein [Candidatus Hydrogenedentota bacterium]